MAMDGKQWALAIAAMIVVVPAAQYLGRAAGERQNAADQSSSEERFASIGQDTKVMVSRQTSDGVANSDITTEGAEAIGQWTLERTRHHADRVLKAMDSADSTSGMSQTSMVVPNNGQNLIVTRLYLGETNFAVQVAGIDGSDLIRVMCMAPRGDQDVLLAGKCAEGLQEQFGFVMPGS